MTGSRCIALIAAATLLGGSLFQGVRTILDQRAQLQDLRLRIEGLEQQLGTRIRDRDALMHDLALAERQLDELLRSQDSASGDADHAWHAEMAAWLTRMKRLKQLFEERPDQRIPEMRLLTDYDWLRVTKQIALRDEDGIRKAFAGVRSVAKKRSAELLAKAVPKFAKASKGEAPASALMIAPYLGNAADTEFLARVEVDRVAVSEESARRGALGWRLREKSAVDPAYDDRYEIHANGSWGMTPAPQAWIPGFEERSRQAYRDFAAAKGNAGYPGLAELLPYFDPPLDQATAETLIKAERANWR